MGGRDTRRAFTLSQKHEILYQQNIKCAECHKPLDLRAVEYHHIKAWAAQGRTKTQNGAALCPTCHSLKTHKERLKKLDKKDTTMKPAPATVLSKLTPRQLESLAQKHKIILRGKYVDDMFSSKYVAPPKSRYVEKLAGIVTQKEINSLLKL